MVELLDKNVLFKLTIVVGIPAGAIDEIEIEGHFQKSSATLNEFPRQQTSLAELAAVSVAKVCGFGFQIKRAHELTTRE